MELGPVVGWFLSKDHRVKLQADVSYVDIPTTMQPSSEILVGSEPSLAISSSSTGHVAGDSGVMTRIQLQIVW